jgi:hypothetical protein
VSPDRVLARIAVQGSQVIEAKRRGGIFWADDLLPDPERFLVERLGFRVVPDLFEKGTRGYAGQRRSQDAPHYARQLVIRAGPETETKGFKLLIANNASREGGKSL